MKNMNESAARIIRYRETAATLRRQAAQIHSDQVTVDQLLDLAERWEQLAVSAEKAQF
ncbi:MAG TPA: hypothetical protein VGP42_07235 [Stellaceae bacterium]|nr:hypothetical protein [Stellaceae bacterium]